MQVFVLLPQTSANLHTNDWLFDRWPDSNLPANDVSLGNFHVSRVEFCAERSIVHPTMNGRRPILTVSLSIVVDHNERHPRWTTSLEMRRNGFFDVDLLFLLQHLLFTSQRACRRTNTNDNWIVFYATFVIHLWHEVCQRRDRQLKFSIWSLESGSHRDDAVSWKSDWATRELVSIRAKPGPQRTSFGRKTAYIGIWDNKFALGTDKPIVKFDKPQLESRNLIKLWRET